MKIETSLISLSDAVNEGVKLSSNSKVLLPTGVEANIYGFIAMYDDMLSSIIDMPPLGECKVLSNRAIFYLDKQLYRFPIFHSVSKVTEQKYNVYLLYISKFINLSSNWDRNSYLETLSKERPNPKVSRLHGVKIEENTAYFYPSENDLYVESKSKFRAIGSDFAVITRRVSKLTDNIKYEIFDSLSVKIEQK